MTATLAIRKPVSLVENESNARHDVHYSFLETNQSKGIFTGYTFAKMSFSPLNLTL